MAGPGPFRELLSRPVDSEHNERIWDAAVRVYPALISGCISAAAFAKTKEDDDKFDKLLAGLPASALNHAVCLVAAYEKWLKSEEK